MLSQKLTQVYFCQTLVSGLILTHIAFLKSTYSATVQWVFNQNFPASFCQREPFPTSLSVSILSDASCWFAASAFHRLVLSQQGECGSERHCTGRGAGDLAAGRGRAQVLLRSGYENVTGLLGALQVPSLLRFSSCQVHYVKGLSKLLGFTSRVQQSRTSPPKSSQSL